MTGEALMRPWSPARIEALERRGVAIHEAGHAVIARHVGARDISAYIFRRDDAGPGDNTWGGQARYGRLHKLSRKRRTMIAVAGAIAEYVWSDEVDVLEDEHAWWEEAIMSPSDWSMAERNPGEPDAAFMRAVGRAIDLLSGKLRAELYATARRLIAESRIAA
jgi:hypothetical protein